MSARAQEPVVAFEGSEIFCHILKHFKLEPIAAIEDLAKHSPDEALIIVFGDLTKLDEIENLVDHVDQFPQLLACDRATTRFATLKQPEFRRFREPVNGPWNMQISGLEVRQSEETAYQGKSRCPFLLVDQLDVSHPVLRGVVQGIATNRPSVLHSLRHDLRRLAEFPPDCRSIDGRRLNLRDSSAGYIFCSKDDVQHKLLFLAGHGVFMNGMLAQFDNDNFVFAANTIRWLREGPQGKRQYALMIHDGRVIDSFDLPLTAPAKLPMPPIHVINRMLRELENERVFHRFLEETVGWETILRLVLIAVSVALLAYGFYRLLSTRLYQEAVPLVVGLTPPLASARPVLQQRQLELLAQDNLWEPAQALARQWFLDHAGVNPPLWDEADHAAPPTAAYRTGWLERRKLDRQVAALWAYALRDPSRRVSVAEFERLSSMLNELTHALARGALTFRDGGRRTG